MKKINLWGLKGIMSEKEMRHVLGGSGAGSGLIPDDYITGGIGTGSGDGTGSGSGVNLECSRKCTIGDLCYYGGRQGTCLAPSISSDCYCYIFV